MVDLKQFLKAIDEFENYGIAKEISLIFLSLPTISDAKIFNDDTNSAFQNCENITFEGVEYGDRKILLRTTMELTDITIPSNNATLDLSLADVINSKKEEQERR